MKKKREKSGNGDGIFKLKEEVAGNHYLSPGIQGLAGQVVVPVGFEVRKIDRDKSVLAVVRGKDGRRQSLPFCYFSQCPPEEALRQSAVRV